MYREVDLRFGPNEDSSTKAMDPGILNGTKGSDLFVDELGQAMECNKECYAITVAVAVTFLAGIYQVWLCCNVIPVALAKTSFGHQLKL